LVNTYSGTYPPIAVIAAFMVSSLVGAKIGPPEHLEGVKKEKVAQN